MHEYRATIEWEDAEGKFSTGKYSRAHSWSFDGGIRMPASSSPSVVALPYSKEDAVDPEEAFVASISSCHMLTFLYVAYKAKLTISRYVDTAVGIMERDAEGREWISSVELSPRIAFAGREPEREELDRLHEEAHRGCYIANSVKTKIAIRS